MPKSKVTGRAGAVAMTAAQLAPLFNGYTWTGTGPADWTIVVPSASKLAALDEVTVSGTLLPKELTTLPRGSTKRQLRLDPQGYQIEKGDGDLHFCLGPGTSPSANGHIGCELQKASGWLPKFDAQLKKPIAVTGYFRCLFEHPGFQGNADAHIFEIHPVRTVGPLGGTQQPFDVRIPVPAGIHAWEGTHVPCNEWDAAMKVKYDKAKDTLTFTGMHGQDKNYVQVAGTISGVAMPAQDRVATFQFASPDIAASPLVGEVLPTSSAWDQLAARKTGAHAVWMVALRSIDLSAALAGRYRIKLLAINIRDKAHGPAIDPKLLGAAP